MISWTQECIYPASGAKDTYGIKPFRAPHNRSMLISPNAGIFFFLQLFCLFLLKFFRSSGADHLMVSICEAVMASNSAFIISYTPYPSCISLRCKRMQFQPSSVYSIIRTKLPGLSYPSLISSIDRNIFSHLRFHDSHSKRVYYGSSSRPTLQNEHVG